MSDKQGAKRAKQKAAAHQRWRRNTNSSRVMLKAHLKRYYELTLDGYDALLKEQDNRCGICRCVPTENQRLHVDHDHATGQVRGLLCRGCNTLLGGAGDDQQILVAAINYLDRSAR